MSDRADNARQKPSILIYAERNHAMRIIWLGHSCFAIQSGGLRLVCDPFDPQMVGYPPPDIMADIVTISHEHDDHNYTRTLRGRPLILRGSGEQAAPRGWRIRGIDSFHDDQQGAKRGPNTLFMIEAEGIRILHCGDLGHLLAEDTLAALRPIDILMVPVGGFYTIDAGQAAALCRALDPKIALPMHYRTPHTPDFPIESQAPFLKLLNIPAVGPLEYLDLEACALAAQKDMRVVLFAWPKSAQSVDILLAETIE